MSTALPLPASHGTEDVCAVRDQVRLLLVSKGIDAWPSGRDVELGGDIRPGCQMRLRYAACGRWTATFGSGEYAWPVTTIEDVGDLHDILARSTT